MKWDTIIERDFWQENLKTFLASPKKVLLIKGSSGSGKTALCQLIQQHYANKRPITYFDISKLSDSKTLFVPQNAAYNDPRGIIIFDNYGDNHQFINLFQTQNLHQWQGKIIITCHPYYLLNYDDYSAYFAPIEKNKIQHSLLQQIEIPALTQDEILQILQASSIQSTVISAFLDCDAIDTTVLNPLLLQFTFQAYQKIKSRSQDYYRQFYDDLLSDWILYQKNRLTTIHSYDEQFAQNLKKLSIALANEMETQKLAFITYQPQSDLFSDDISVWSAYFTAKSKQSKLVQISLPLHYHNHQIQLWSRNLQTSLASQHITTINLSKNTESLQQATTENSLLLTDKDLLKNLPLLQLLADRVHTSPVFKKYLTQTVISSRVNPNMATAASNALTILNAARISFCGKDLSKIQVPDAVLDKGLFANTKWNEANIKRVRFKDAFLSNANLNDADAEDIEFGEDARIDAHHTMITSLVASKNGRYLASYSLHPQEFQGIIIWDMNTLEHAQQINEEHLISALVFDPESNYLIYSLLASEICVYDIKTAEIIDVFHTNLERIYNMVHIPLPDKKYLGLVGIDKQQLIKVIIYDYENNLTHSIPIPITYPSKLFSPLTWRFSVSADGTKLAFCPFAIEFTILIDTLSKRIIKKIEHGSMNNCQAIDFSHDSKKLLVGTLNQLFVFDTTIGDFIYSVDLSHQLHLITSFATSPHVPWLVINDESGKSFLWDIADKSFITTFNGNEKILCMQIIKENNNTLLCSGGINGTIQIRHMNLKHQYKETRLNQSPAIAYLQKQNLMITGGADGKVRLWDFQNARCINEFHAHQLDIHALLLVEEQNAFITAGADGQIIIWDLSSFTQKYSFKASQNEINCLTYAKQNNMFASAGYDKKLRFWDLSTGQPLDEFDIVYDTEQNYKNAINAICFTPCGQYILTGDNEGNFKQWSLQEKSLTNERALCNSSISSIAISPDGKYRICGNYDNYFYFLNESSIEPNRTSIHLGEISTTHFTSDSKCFITGSHDGMIYVWQTSSAKILFEIQGEQSGIMSSYLTPDNKYLCLSRWSGSLELWELENQSARLLQAIGFKLSANNLKFRQTKNLSLRNKLLLDRLAVDEGGISVYRQNYLLANSINHANRSTRQLLKIFSHSLKRTTDEHKHLRVNLITLWLLKHPEVLFCSFNMTTRLIDIDNFDEIDHDPILKRLKNKDITSYATILDDSNQYVRLALKHGASITMSGDEKYSLIDVVLLRKSNYLLSFLLQHGFNIHKNKTSPTSSAVTSGNLEGLKIISSLGAPLTEPEMILKAIRYGYLEIIQFLESQDINTDFVVINDEVYYSPYHAVACGHLHIIQHYIKNKEFDVNFQDNDNNSLLLCAVKYGYPDIALFLLQEGADPFLENNKGENAFHHLLTHMNESLIRYLITIPKYQHGLTSLLSNGGTLLNVAIVKGHKAIADDLISIGCSLIAIRGTLSVLGAALHKDYIDIVKKIIAIHPHLIDSDQKIFNILNPLADLRAVNIPFESSKSILYLITLIKNKSFVNEEDGKTFLILCTELSQPEAVKHVFTPNIINHVSYLGISALMIASHYNERDIIHFLLSQGADTELQDYEDNNTALMFGAFSGSFEAVNELCEQKIDIDQRDKRGLTALLIASQNGFRRICKTLIDKGKANIKLQSYTSKFTVFSIACCQGHFGIVKMLGDRNISFNEKGQYGFSPIHYAIQSEHYYIVQYLVCKLRVRLDVATDNGFSPIMMIAKFDQLEMAKCLLKNGVKFLDDFYETAVLIKGTKIASYLNRTKEHEGKLLQAIDTKFLEILSVNPTEKELKSHPINNLIKNYLQSYLFLAQTDQNNQTLLVRLSEIKAFLLKNHITLPATFDTLMRQLKEYQSTRVSHRLYSLPNAPLLFNTKQIIDEKSAQEKNNTIDDLDEEEQLNLALAMSYDQPGR